MLQMLTVYLRHYLQREEGQDLIEYALLVGFIAIVAAIAVQAAGTQVSTVFQNIANALATLPPLGGS